MLRLHAYELASSRDSDLGPDREADLILSDHLWRWIAGGLVAGSWLGASILSGHLLLPFAVACFVEGPFRSATRPAGTGRAQWTIN